jgi:hypothetical protein
MNQFGGRLQEGNRGRRTIVERFRELERRDLHIGGRSVRLRYRQQHGTHGRNGARHHTRICVEMLSHGMRRIGVSASMVEIETVERAGRNTDANRQDREQHDYVPDGKPVLFASKQIRSPPHLG